MGIVRVSNAKMKEFEPPAPESFTPKKIELDGYVSSIVLEKTDYTPANKSKGSLSLNASKALQCLHDAIAQHGITPPKSVIDTFPDSPHNIPKTVVSIEQWRVLAMKQLLLIVKAIKNKRQCRWIFTT